MKKIGQQLLPLIVGLIIIIPAIVPCFQSTLFRVHDYTHVARLAELDRTLIDGFIPPRWSRNFGFGFGMPLFSFYAPLPYYVGEGIHLLGFGYEQSIQLVFALVFYLSFLAMYYLASCYWSRLSSYLSATLFIYIPYRAVDTYVRGSLGELYGILFIVVAMYCLTKLTTMVKLKWMIFTALATAGLLLSHNLMALIGVPLIGLYGIVLTGTNRKTFWRVGGMIVGSLLWGLGVAAYFAIPAIMEKSFTSVDQLTTGGGDYTQHFVYLKQLFNSPFGYGGSIAGPHDGISYEIGKLHLFLLVITLGLLLWKWGKIPIQQRLVVLFSGIIFILSVFLMSFHSLIVWQVVPILKYLQFPWRLLSIPMIFTPLIIGLVVDQLAYKWKRVRVVTAVSIIVLTILFYGSLFKPEHYASPSLPIYSTDAPYIQQTMSSVIPDYIHPQLASLVLATKKDIAPPTTRFMVAGHSQPRMTVLTDSVQSFALKIEGTGEATVSANIFDFPGWQWFVDGKSAHHFVGTTLPIMSTIVTIPASGSVEVSASLIETPIRTLSDWISVISLVLIGLVSVFVLVSRKKDYGNNR